MSTHGRFNPTIEATGEIWTFIPKEKQLIMLQYGAGIQNDRS
jgi:thiamine biosynthesis lipoprotein ApbE